MSLNTTSTKKTCNPYNNIPIKYFFITLHMTFLCLLETEKQDAAMFPFKSMRVYAGYTSVVFQDHRVRPLSRRAKSKKRTIQRRFVFCRLPEPRCAAHGEGSRSVSAEDGAKTQADASVVLSGAAGVISSPAVKMASWWQRGGVAPGVSAKPTWTLLRYIINPLHLMLFNYAANKCTMRHFCPRRRGTKQV